ncbi:MAG: hypothetical protein JWP25_719 [Bradyrhizobium sp.]|nr:hypothetical protein [Bradyrhizobium sp.]
MPAAPCFLRLEWRAASSHPVGLPALRGLQLEHCLGRLATWPASDAVPSKLAVLAMQAVELHPLAARPTHSRCSAMTR